MEVNFFTWTTKVYRVTLKDSHHAEFGTTDSFLSTNYNKILITIVLNSR